MKWIMRIWPQTLSTSPLSHLFYIGWHHRRALSYQLSFLQLLLTLHFSPTFISAVSALCVHSLVCVVIYGICVGKGRGDKWSEKEDQQRPDDLIYSLRLSKTSTDTCVSQKWSVQIVIWSVCHFNLFKVLELSERVYVCLTAGYLAIVVGRSAGLSMFP